MQRRGSLLSLAAMVVAGISYGLCFPPAGLKPLAWVTLAPLLVCIRRATFARSLLLAALFTATATCATVDWLPKAVSGYYQQPFVVGAALFLAVMLLMVVPYVCAFAGAYHVAARRRSSLLPAYAAAAWVAAELGRSTFLTGNPWVLLGYSQVGVDHVVQIADVAGVYGVSFLVTLVNASLAEAWLAVRDERKLDRVALRGLALASLALVSALAYGHRRLSVAEPPAPTVKIGIVQGNVDLGSQWQSDFYGRNLRTYLELSLDLLRQANLRLVFWPENAMSFFVEDEPLYGAAIGRVLEPFGAQLVAGGPRIRRAPAEHYYNSAFLVSADGSVTGRYDKEKLVPFGEYFPLPKLDLLRRSFERVREFTPGEATPPLPTLAGRAGVLICNEAMFPTISRRRVRAGAEYLVSLSNDGWINDWKYSAIALDMSVLRAVETRRYLVRASTSGPSAIADPQGRVLARSGFFSRETLVGDIAPGSGETLYARYGDAFALTCMVVAFAPLLTAALRSANGRSRSRAGRP